MVGRHGRSWRWELTRDLRASTSKEVFSCKIAAMKSRAILIFIALSAGRVLAQQSQNSPGELNPRVQQFMDVEVGFEEMIPPGMSIEAREVLRRGSSGHELLVQYHIFVKGVPPSTLFRAGQGRAVTTCLRRTQYQNWHGHRSRPCNCQRQRMHD